ARRGWIRVVGDVRIGRRLDVLVALVGKLLAGLVGGRLIGEPRDDAGDDHDGDDRDAGLDPAARRAAGALALLRLRLRFRHAPRSRDGGSVWESNPPPTCLEPDTGFEVREAHRVPRRFRRCPTRFVSAQRLYHWASEPLSRRRAGGTR